MIYEITIKRRAAKTLANLPNKNYKLRMLPRSRELRFLDLVLPVSYLN